MSSIDRKIKRQKEKKAKKQQKKDISQKMGMFDRMPEECSACEARFDKKDREMVATWNVVVREEEKIVRLYCPDCWDSAKRIIKEAQDATRSTDI
jgi:predicted RNA-binding Zn-ribbon protein involved in translation (DUF1610 family)